MNIFVSDISPIKSAQNLDDKRVRHMPKECFEMISMAYYRNTGNCIAPFIIWNREHRLLNQEKFNDLFYNKCTNWVAANRENMWWLWLHALALLDEYWFRFKQEYYLEQQFIAISHFIPVAINLPKSFANASGFDSGDIIYDYKKCLNYKWFITDEIKPVIWTNRDKPHWAKLDENIQLHINTQVNIGDNNQIGLFNSEDDLPF